MVVIVHNKLFDMLPYVVDGRCIQYTFWDVAISTQQMVSILWKINFQAWAGDRSIKPCEAKYWWFCWRGGEDPLSFQGDKTLVNSSHKGFKFVVIKGAKICNLGNGSPSPSNLHHHLHHPLPGWEPGNKKSVTDSKCCQSVTPLLWLMYNCQHWLMLRTFRTNVG